MCLIVLHLSGEIEKVLSRNIFFLRCAPPSISLKSPGKSVLKPLKESGWWGINFYMDKLSSTENLEGQVIQWKCMGFHV